MSTNVSYSSTELTQNARLNLRPATIPQEMQADPQWFAWGYQSDPGKKPRKRSTNAITGAFCDATNPDNYASFETAYRLFQRKSWVAGLSYGLNNNGLVMVDLDACWDGAALTPFAKMVVRTLDSYAEISPSGTGIRIFLRADVVINRKPTNQPIEIYSSGRQATVTGRRIANLPTEPAIRDDELLSLIGHLGIDLGCNQVTDEHTPPEWFGSVVASNALTPDDQRRWDRMMSGKSGPKIKALLNKQYADASQNDWIFLRHLAFWADNDPARMYRMAVNSPLDRAKWHREEKTGDFLSEEINRMLININNGGNK